MVYEYTCLRGVSKSQLGDVDRHHVHFLMDTPVDGPVARYLGLSNFPAFLAEHVCFRSPLFCSMFLTTAVPSVSTPLLTLLGQHEVVLHFFLCTLP